MPQREDLCQCGKYHNAPSVADPDYLPVVHGRGHSPGAPKGEVRISAEELEEETKVEN